MKELKENIYNYCVANNLDDYVDAYINYLLLIKIKNKNNFNISISNEMIDLEYELGQTRK
jgi:hypothetical protein